MSERSQPIRIFDVLVLGPAMIYAAYVLKGDKRLKSFILVGGIGTIVYNFKNYLKIEARR